MKFHKTEINDLLLIDLERKTDSRGAFARTFCKKEFEAVGLDLNWVQMNQSDNLLAGTFRGLHFQNEPYGEVKLVRCITGAVIDIVVDLRKDSPTFLKSIQVELSAKNGKMILIPKGFAHGFLTLEDNTSLIYHHSEYYTPEAEGGISYLDPKLNLVLPAPVKVISERDLSYPFLR